MSDAEIEAAARAAYESEYDPGDLPWGKLSPGEQLGYRHMAKAALAAAERAHTKPIATAPQAEEILAWHKQGKNWHQVYRDGDRFRMRWCKEYLQFLGDFSHWQPLPGSPLEGKAE